MNILVIDVGTSSMRGILYNKKGEKLYLHQVQYRVIYSENEYAEQDPKDWKFALYEVVRGCVTYANDNNVSVDGMALTCQRSSVIPVDEKGEPLRTAIMWLDKRNRSICTELEEYQDLIFAKTGARINAVFSGSKMTWLKRNQPEIYKKSSKILTIADYLAFLITGEFKTDHTYGSRSSLMEIRNRRWDQDLLRIYEIDQEKLCDLIEPGDILGVTSDSFAMETGIASGIPLVSAGGDQQCAALGQGVLEQGTMELTTGTGAFALTYSTQVPLHLKPEVICGAHAMKGAYVLESSMLACCSLYDWFRNNFYEVTNQNYPYESINNEIAMVAAGANGCIALPYFQGRGTPDWNSKATGLFAKITLQTTKADMARALLESIAYEACNNIKILEKYVGDINRIFIGGGLTKFPVFNQIQADVYHKELICYKAGEETSLGAFMSAGVTLGAFEDYKEAFTTVTEHKVYDQYEYQNSATQIYEQKRMEVNDLYERLTRLT